MTMSKCMLSVNCCSTDSVARFLNKKVLILVQLCPTCGAHAARSKVCAVQFRCSLWWKYPTHWQPVLIFLIFILEL